uniref:Uncharacterized protein n=1 Tax=viral metagenome TaxID=1070528 RepID=A0A2V0RMR2_9ZZZZ
MMNASGKRTTQHVFEEEAGDKRGASVLTSSVERSEQAEEVEQSDMSGTPFGAIICARSADWADWFRESVDLQFSPIESGLIPINGVASCLGIGVVGRNQTVHSKTWSSSIKLGCVARNACVYVATCSALHLLMVHKVVVIYDMGRDGWVIKTGGMELIDSVRAHMAEAPSDMWSHRILALENRIARELKAPGLNRATWTPKRRKFEAFKQILTVGHSIGLPIPSKFEQLGLIATSLLQAMTGHPRRS